MGKLKPSSELQRRLGEQFRKTREYRECSLRKLSGEIGVPVYLIRRHEAGALSLRADKLVEAATFLKVRPGELLQTGHIE